MKVQSKKDQYTVICENSKQTCDVLNYMHNDSDRTWSHWEYVTRIGDEDTDITENNEYEFPVISFEQWQSLPDVTAPEYDPKDVAFKPIGYKFKDEKIRNIITAFLGSIESYKTNSYDFPVKSYVYMELKELQVLDLWCDKVLFEKESEFNSSNAFKELKIIGYKLIKPEYKEAVNALISQDKDSNWILENTVKSGNALWEDLYITGVLDIWFEPVFDTSITLKSGVKLSEDDIAEVKELIEMRQVCKDLEKEKKY